VAPLLIHRGTEPVLLQRRRVMPVRASACAMARMRGGGAWCLCPRRPSPVRPEPPSQVFGPISRGGVGIKKRLSNLIVRVSLTLPPDKGAYFFGHLLQIPNLNLHFPRKPQGYQLY